MIAEAAYFRAEHRGFQGGDPLDDWLQAEAEIDRMAAGAAEPAREKLADQLAAQLRQYDGEFTRLTAKARGLSTAMRNELERELERLKPLRTSAEQALAEVRQRAGHATEDLLALGDKVRTELADTLERLAKRLS
jgi:ABC-type transporter Mla subunit MlaD